MNKRFQLGYQKLGEKPVVIEVDNVRVSDTHLTYKESVNQGRWTSIGLRFITELHVDHLAVKNEQ